MSLKEELTSWFSPTYTQPISPAPTHGSPAPPNPSNLQLIEPGKPTIIAFLRHCGCPWAEKTFLQLRASARANADVEFVAVSHSSESHTREWVEAVKTGNANGTQEAEPGNLRVLVDEEAETYAAWGMGVAGWGQVVSLPALWEVYKVGRDEGIKNRPTRSGSRWQRSGMFGVDAEGIVRWGRPTERADEMFDFAEGVRRVKAEGAAKL